jgi:cell division protein FtsW
MSDSKDVPWVLAAKTGKIGFANRLGRGDRSPLGVWFWELDRVLLSLMMVLIAIGLLAVAAASPAGAQRLSASTSQLSSLYFFYRQLMWVIVGVPIMLFISMCPREKARRIAVYGFCIVFVLLVLVPVLGREVNGSRRWIGAGFAGLQPSEFLKPFYAVTMAWIISWRLKDPSLPVLIISSIVTAAVCFFLLMQPDLGQTILFMGTWFALMMVAGVPASRLWGLIISGIIFIVLAYNFYPVATQRIDAWIFGTEGLTHDKMALATLINGGFIGLGPGLGVKKYSLPEGHTDYIFSVIGEEFGLLACMVIAILYFAILVRIIIRLLDEKDQFVVLAVTGLGAQFCGQAMINIAVNLGVFPSKGMTLPFISYGGTALVTLGFGAGILMSIHRHRRLVQS